MTGSSGIDESKKEMAAYREAILYKALVKFKRDMGYYPGDPTGELDFDSIDNKVEFYDEDNNEVEYSFVEADFNEQTLFFQLVQQPIDDSDTDIIRKWDWSTDYKKGWQGPYLDNRFMILSFDEWLKSKYTQEEIEQLTTEQKRQENFLRIFSIPAYEAGIQTTYFKLYKQENTYYLSYILLFEGENSVVINKELPE